MISSASSTCTPIGKNICVLITAVLAGSTAALAFMPSIECCLHHATSCSSISSKLSGAMSRDSDLERSSSFDSLTEHISRVATRINDSADVQLIASSESTAEQYNNVTEINSLIFRPKPSHIGDDDADGVYAVAVVQSTDKVDVVKLSEYLAEDSEYSRWELAPSYLVEHLCGFRPGSIPPLGYPTEPVKIIVDTSLTLLPEGQQLVGGGGNLEYRCLIQSHSFLTAVGAEVSDIISSRERLDGGMLMESLEYSSKVPKPFFPVAPPVGHISDGGSHNAESPRPKQPHQPIPVTAIGRITSVRRIAKRLVFADFAPPDYPMASLSAAAHQSKYEKDMPWRSGEDGGDMYVQLIVGKTFCDSLGENEGPEALKSLKPGKLVLARGAANVDPRQKNGWSNSAGNWEQKRSLDVIVSSFDILSESDEVDGAMEGHRRSLGLLPWELKEQRVLSNSAATKEGVKAQSPPPNASSYGPILTLALFDSQLQGSPTDVVFVDTEDKVESMSKTFSDLQSLSIAAEADDDILDFLIGIDCEWRPTGTYFDDFDGNPVALLQISVPALRTIFLVDTYALLRPGLSQSDAMDQTEALLSEAITTIFQATTIIKTGFHVPTDFRRLAASFPQVPAFREVHAVVELSTLARKVHPTTSRHSIGSLQRLTRLVLGFDVSKVQQCSDWQKRPLTPDQSEYAALDCALPPRLLDEMAEGAGRAKMEVILPQLMSSWRFVVMDSDCQEAITVLKAKRVVGSTFAVSQSWLTNKPKPAVPAMPTESGGPYIDKSGIARISSHMVNIHETSDGSGSFWDNIVGESIGKSKGKCVEMLASLPNATRLEYNPRSGFVPFQDGIVLFVNAPNPNQSRRSPYPNEWLDGGRVLTWYLRDKDWGGGKSKTAQLLGFGGPTGSKKPSAVLFVRSANGEFVCCGRCYASVPVLGGLRGKKNLIKLHIQLADWDVLNEKPAFSGIMSDMANDKADAAETKEANVVDVAEVTDSTSFQECLACMVIEGNVVDALGFALEASETNPKKRSIAAGIGCLKNLFARSNDADVLRAVEILDDAAANLGLL